MPAIGRLSGNLSTSFVLFSYWRVMELAVTVNNMDYVLYSISYEPRFLSTMSDQNLDLDSFVKIDLYGNDIM